MMTPISGTRFGITAFGIVLALALGSAADAQTAQSKLSPDEMYALAREAYLYAYPTVSMDVSMRQATNVPDTTSVNMRAPVNQFAHARAYPKADEKDVVRFNFDTLYSLAWLDLSREPTILSVPDTNGRYYLLPMIDEISPVERATAVGTKRTRQSRSAMSASDPRGLLVPFVGRCRVRGDVDRMIKAHRWYRVGDTVMLSATAMALALIVTHAPAQTWKDLKCTGDSDIPWSE